jgi:hypothetical protein
MGGILRTGVVVTILSATSCGNGDTGGSNTSSDPVYKAAAIVVTLDDLPSSWRDQAHASDGEGGSGSCLDSVTEAAKVLGPSVADSKAVSFAQSDLGPFLIAMVTTRIDDAETSFEALVNRLETCDGSTDAVGFTTVIEPLTFPTIGNEAFAGKAIATNPNGSSLSYLLAMARVDNTLVLAAHVVTLGELDVALVENVVRAMVGRA